MSKTMAEVLAEHGFRKWGDRLDDFNWVVCLCGATIGGSEKWQTLLAQHQTAALTAAGFGLVADAKAEALERASEEIDWIRPETGPGINITQYREGRNDAFTSASVWLRARAAKLREPVKPTPEGR